MVIAINTIVSTIKKIYRHGIPSYILLFGDSLGDNLLLTILARELNIRGHKNVWIKCDHHSLFTNNPDIRLVLPYKTLLSTYILKLFNVQVVSPQYSIYDPVTERASIPEKHFVLKMADCLNIKGDITNKPYFFLDEEEISKGVYNQKQIAITTLAPAEYKSVKNKEWYIERYQQIVDKFSTEYQFIQIGTKNDLPLNHVIDMRGKTNFRESASILKSSALLVSYAGFMMHLARAVDCPSVIVYGGREKPEQTGYQCFKNVYVPVECSPCWLDSFCPYDKKCMNMITTDMVEQKIREQLQAGDKPLTADLLHNS